LRKQRIASIKLFLFIRTMLLNSISTFVKSNKNTPSARICSIRPFTLVDVIIIWKWSNRAMPFSGYTRELLHYVDATDRHLLARARAHTCICICICMCICIREQRGVWESSQVTDPLNNTRFRRATRRVRGWLFYELRSSRVRRREFLRSMTFPHVALFRVKGSGFYPWWCYVELDEFQWTRGGENRVLCSLPFLYARYTHVGYVWMIWTSILILVRLCVL